MLIRAGVLAALLLSGSLAVAEECPLPEGANSKLAAIDSAQRLEYLRMALNTDAQAAQTWKWRWVGGYGVIAVGQLLTAPFTTTVDQRPGLYVGGIASVIGTLPLLLMPLHVGHDGPMFDAKVKAAGGATCSLIKEGEALLIHDAENEVHSANWVQHVISIVYNGIVAVIIGAGYHNWLSGGLSGGVGALLGETKILSQPVELDNAWHTYQSGVLQPDGAPKLRFGAAAGNYMALSGTF